MDFDFPHSDPENKALDFIAATQVRQPRRTRCHYCRTLIKQGYMPGHLKTHEKLIADQRKDKKQHDEIAEWQAFAQTKVSFANELNKPLPF